MDNLSHFQTPVQTQVPESSCKVTASSECANLPSCAGVPAPQVISQALCSAGTAASSPNTAVYFHTEESTLFFLADGLIAVVPPVFGAVWYFGTTALFTLFLAVLSCTFFDCLGIRLFRKQWKLDPYCFLSGILYGLLLWPGVGILAVLTGAFCAMILAKQIFGGYGKNWLNPALVGFGVVLILQGPAPMGQGLWLVSGNIQGLFLETSLFFSLLGAGYLWFRRMANVPFALSFSVILLALGHFGGVFTPHFLGRIFFFSWFLASDPVTTATTPLGNLIWGILCALLCGGFWLLGDLTGGMVFSFCFMSFCIRSLRRWDWPIALHLS